MSRCLDVLLSLCRAREVSVLPPVPELVDDDLFYGSDFDSSISDDVNVRKMTIDTHSIRGLTQAKKCIRHRVLSYVRHSVPTCPSSFFT